MDFGRKKLNILFILHLNDLSVRDNVSSGSRRFRVRFAVM